MKKISLSLALTITIAVIGCSSSKNPLGLYRILQMNKKEFNALKEASIEDARGFKYIKETLQKNKFNTTSATNKNQVLNNEDRSRINKILDKY